MSRLRRVRLALSFHGDAQLELRLGLKVADDARTDCAPVGCLAGRTLRIRLLGGVDVASARFSNPTVALISSRSTAFAGIHVPRKRRLNSIAQQRLGEGRIARGARLHKLLEASLSAPFSASLTASVTDAGNPPNASWPTTMSFLLPPFCSARQQGYHLVALSSRNTRGFPVPNRSDTPITPPPTGLALEELPCSSRASATVTFAAATPSELGKPFFEWAPSRPRAP